MEELKFYAIQLTTGEWYRARSGNRSSGWVKELKKAKIYGNVSQARSRITMFANENRIVPDLIEFTLTGSRVVDETERLARAKLEKQQKLDAQEVRRVEFELKRAEHAMQQAKERIASLSSGRKF